MNTKRSTSTHVCKHAPTEEREREGGGYKNLPM